MNIFGKKEEWIRFKSCCIKFDEIYLFETLISDDVPHLLFHHKNGAIKITYEDILQMNDDYELLLERVGAVDSFND